MGRPAQLSDLCGANKQGCAVVSRWRQRHGTEWQIKATVKKDSHSVTEWDAHTRVCV